MRGALNGQIQDAYMIPTCIPLHSGPGYRDVSLHSEQASQMR